MKKIILMILIPLLLIAAIVGGVMYYTDKTQKKVEVFSVATLNSASWWEDDSSLTGTLTSDYVQSVQLSSGREVEKIYVKTGDMVKPGDNLLKYNVQEQELDLQLQELQIQSSTLAIENLQKELEKLKGTKTKGAMDGRSDLVQAYPYNVSLLPGDGSVLIADNETDPSPESTTTAPEEGSTGKEDSSGEGSTSEEASTDASSQEEPTDDSGSSSEDPTEPTDDTGGKPDPDDDEKKKDIPTSKTITSTDQRAKYSSGDGKSAKKPYVFLLVKKEVEVEVPDPNSKTGTIKKIERESIPISGSLINKLIDKGIYAVFKEYTTLDAYDKAPDKPTSTITITPKSRFSETVSDKAKYTISDLKSILIMISKLEISPKKKSVTAGKSYAFKAMVTGKNVKGVTASWKLSGNKSKSTYMSGGTLRVASDETAKKIKITVTVNEKKASMTLKVKKKKSSGGGNGGNGNGNGNGGGNGGGSGNGGNGGGGGSDDDDTYTAEELKEAIEEKEEEIANAKTELNEAKISYEEAKKEVEAATIKAKIAGKVETACTLDSLPTDESPAIVVRADDGIYVKTQINEMDLETIKVGGTITCTTWDTEEKYEAIVKEISDYPVNITDMGVEGNPNASYYPIVAYIEEAEGLNPGDSVNIKYSSKSMGTVDANTIYLQKAYVRTDSDGSYVYKAGKNKRLEKQYIKTGKTLNGQYLEVLGGITEEDYLAFPYGNKVKEGAKTKISENDENIIY